MYTTVIVRVGLPQGLKREENKIQKLKTHFQKFTSRQDSLSVKGGAPMNVCIYACITFFAPLPWPNDLHIQTKNRYSENVSAYQEQSF